MKEYGIYFRGPIKGSDKFPYEPKPEHMYADFVQVMHSSGYSITKAGIKYDMKNGLVEIEVNGVK